MIAALALVVALLGSSSLGATAASACPEPPVRAPVAVPYRAPACRYCPGHRGLQYATTPGTPVVAVAPGTVTFVGQVAGTGYVVVAQADGLTATYGFVVSPSVRRGQQVPAGRVVARSTDRVYFGWRRGEVAVDPTPVLGRWRSRVRLLPRDGTRSRPAGGAIMCPTSGATADPGR